MLLRLAEEFRLACTCSFGSSSRIVFDVCETALCISPSNRYRTWDYLQFDKVAWGVLPSLLITLISMIFVVALSSSLDVAAIELELRRPLNYSHELKTVGISNIVSGLTGGYTGSYIFSQSIFSLRAGVSTRLNGIVVAVCEIVAVLLPFSVLSYVPIFFSGAC